MTTKAINQKAVLLAATPVILGTVPNGKEWDIRFIRFTNNDPINDHQVTVFDYDPSGTDYPAEVAGPATTEMPAITIEKSSVAEIGVFILKEKRVISAQADAAGQVSARIHGWESDA